MNDYIEQQLLGWGVINDSMAEERKYALIDKWWRDMAKNSLELIDGRNVPKEIHS